MTRITSDRKDKEHSFPSKRIRKRAEAILEPLLRKEGEESPPQKPDHVTRERRPGQDPSRSDRPGPSR